MEHAVIMAGGSGVRLWPMSRRDAPKQLLPLIGGRSLLEMALERLEGLVPPERRYVCAGEAHRQAIRMASPGLPAENILAEPVGRDTLAAVGFSAAVIAKEDPDAVIAVFTADHLIEPLTVFQRRVQLGLALVEEGRNRLLTFCIEPDRPATGFGYVEKGEPVELGEQAARIVQEERSRNDRPRTEPLVFRVKRFVEKPDLERAKEYLRSGRFGWNSGMFVWRAQTILDAIEAYKPAVRQGLEEIAQAWGTKAQDETLARVYPTLEKISVDYAVMEPASTDERFEALTVVMDLQWRDIGSWPAYAQTLEPDEAGNRVAGGQARLLDCSGVLAVSDEPDHLIAAIGLSDVVIVRTRDATLVMPAERAEQLKQLHRTLPEELQ